MRWEQRTAPLRRRSVDYLDETSRLPTTVDKFGDDGCIFMLLSGQGVGARCHRVRTTYIFGTDQAAGPFSNLLKINVAAGSRSDQRGFAEESWRTCLRDR
jgi:hypothetical protein